jgi:hypothetical protein
MRIRDGDGSDPGWKKVGSGINIPDPQHLEDHTNSCELTGCAAPNREVRELTG